MQTIFTAAELKENYQILLRLLGQLQTENDYLQAAMDNLSKIPNNAIPGDIANQAKAIAISELSKNREKTNQKLLETYQKLYEDLRPFLFRKTKSKKSNQWRQLWHQKPCKQPFNIPIISVNFTKKRRTHPRQSAAACGICRIFLL